MFAINLVILSGIFAYFFVSDYPPSLALTLFFVILGSLICQHKNLTKPIDKLIYLLTFIISIFIAIRANGFLTFLNFIGVIYLGCYFILEDKVRNRLDIFQLLFLPIFFLTKLLTVENKYQIKRFSSSKKQENLIAIIISAIVLLIILPLLAAANPIFKTWLDSVTDLFNINNIWSKFFRLELLPFRIIVFGMLAFYIPRILTYIKINHNDEFNQKIGRLSLFLPKMLVSIVLVLFFISQTQLYFADAGTLKNLGLSNSQYAREVFAQLCVVSFIILGLIYFDKDQNKTGRRLTIFLLIEGIFLTLIAFKSDFDYSFLYGFTHKRLYGFSVVFWITGIYILYSYFYIKNLIDKKLLKYTVIYTSLVLMVINLANFDNLIYKYSKPITGQGTDYWYLITFISSDAQAYQDLLDVISSHKINETNNNISLQQMGLSNLVWKISVLQEKYKKFNISSFNLSEYQQYQKIKDIDLTKYKNTLENLNMIKTPEK